MNGGKIKEKAKRGKVDLESKAEKRGRCTTVASYRMPDRADEISRVLSRVRGLACLAVNVIATNNEHAISALAWKLIRRIFKV